MFHMLQNCTRANKQCLSQDAAKSRPEHEDGLIERTTMTNIPLPATACAPTATLAKMHFQRNLCFFHQYTATTESYYHTTSY
jgi:hypothetical protein